MWIYTNCANFSVKADSTRKSHNTATRKLAARIVGRWLFQPDLVTFVSNISTTMIVVNAA